MDSDPSITLLDQRDQQPRGSGLARGTNVGRYIVVGELGRGGMGVVYAAFDPELDRQVALKVLHGGPRDTQDDNSARWRLLREAKAMAQLSHPNVITVHDVGSVGSQVFITMELIHGPTLGAWFREQPRSPQEILGKLLDAGQGLAAAHRRGIVHRDFKPSNVLISAEGTAIVLDFGLARSGTPDAGTLEATDPDSRSPLDQTLTQTGAIVGTPAYLSPEQFGGMAVDARSDQFSFCVTAYECLVGYRPFTGDSLDALATALAVSDPRAFPPDSKVPRFIQRAILRGLERAPDKRWDSMDALLRELSRNPARRRRRWFAAVTTMALASAALAVPQIHQARARSRCLAASEARMQLWKESTREHMREAFAATKSPAAVTAFDIASESIGRDVAQLTDLDREICTAHFVDRALDTEQYGERQRCLDYAAAQLESRLAILIDPDRTVIDRVMAYGRDDWFPIKTCNDSEAIRKQIPAPADPSRSDEVFDVRTVLTRADMLHRMGKLEPALARIDEAAGQAAAIGDDGLLAEVHLREAHIHSDFDHPDKAEVLYRQAIAEAEHSGHAVVAASAWTGWLYSAGYELRRFDEALRFEPIARAAVQRAAGHDLEHMFEANLGLVYLARGSLDKARDQHLEAERLLRARPGPTSPALVETLMGLGIVYAELGQLDQAEAKLQDALEIARDRLGEWHPTTGNVLHNLAVLSETAGHYQRALDYYQRCLALRRRVLPPGNPSTLTTLSGLGTLLGQMGHHEQALPLLQESVGSIADITGSEGDNLLRGLIDLGETLVRLNRSLEALPYLQQADQLSSGRDPYTVVAATTALGRGFLALGQRAEALRQLDKAQALLDKVESTDKFMGWIVYKIGLYEHELDRNRQAIQHLRQALDLMHADSHERDRMRIETASILLDHGETEEAVALLTAAADNALSPGLVVDAHLALAKAVADSDAVAARQHVHKARLAIAPDEAWLLARVTKVEHELDDTIREAMPK